MNFNKERRHSPVLMAHMDKYGGGVSRQAERKMSPEELFNHNVPFALDMAVEYKKYNVDMDDLIQQSMLGMWIAARRYDSSLGFRFITYAREWCRAMLQDYVAGFSNSVRIPRHAWVAHFQELNTGATKVKMTRETLDAAANAMKPKKYLDAPMDNGDVPKDFLPDEAEPHDDVLADSAMRDDLFGALGQLTERHSFVVREFFGLDGGATRTLKDIGQDLGISHERARQLKEEALDFIRTNSGGHFHAVHEHGRLMFGDDVEIPASSERYWRAARRLQDVRDKKKS